MVSPMMPKRFKRCDDPKVSDEFETPEKPHSNAVKMIWMKAYCAALVTDKESIATHIADRAVEAYKKRFGL